MVRLNRLWVISLASRAKMIGVGKPKPMSRRLMMRVFLTTLQNLSSVRKVTKFFSPTQALPEDADVGAEVLERDDDAVDRHVAEQEEQRSRAAANSTYRLQGLAW